SSNEAKIAPKCGADSGLRRPGCVFRHRRLQSGWGCNLTLKEQWSLVGRPWDLRGMFLLSGQKSALGPPSPATSDCFCSTAASVKFRPDDFMLSPFCGSATDTPRGSCFSIAASVKFRPDDFMLSPFCASATDTPRGSCFSSRLAPGHLMMG